jgi:hypothetical protein
MSSREIQIVAFNNPYPANFGGAIDMYYKIKALHEIGVAVHLHLFFFDRADISGLEPYCKTIYTYPQKRIACNHFSCIPFSVKSRYSKRLAERLNSIKAPILLESLRTTSLIYHHKFQQKIAVRCHNIEHHYSYGLYSSEKNILNKVGHLLESLKQKYFEKILDRADVLFPISYFETHYFSNKYKPDTVFLPVFQAHKNVTSLKGFGDYALYHGDLSISDNVRSALFVVNVFKALKIPLIVAGKTVSQRLLSEIDKHENISFRDVRSNEEMEDLIKNAHVNVLYSYQRSGTKLKVFSALYKGRFCIINSNIIDDRSILDICQVAETIEDFRFAIEECFKKEYVPSAQRKLALEKYDAERNAQWLMQNLT